MKPAQYALPLSHVYDRSPEETDRDRAIRALELDLITVGARLLAQERGQDEENS